MPLPLFVWVGIAVGGALAWGIKKAMEDDYFSQPGDHDDTEAENQRRRERAQAERREREVQSRLDTLLKSHRIGLDAAQRDALAAALDSGTEPDSLLLEQFAAAAPAVSEQREQMDTAAAELADVEALAKRMDERSTGSA